MRHIHFRIFPLKFVANLKFSWLWCQQSWNKQGYCQLVLHISESSKTLALVNPLLSCRAQLFPETENWALGRDKNYFSFMHYTSKLQTSSSFLIFCYYLCLQCNTPKMCWVLQTETKELVSRKKSWGKSLKTEAKWLHWIMSGHLYFQTNWPVRLKERGKGGRWWEEKAWE